jgi:hypothetical protein
MQSESDFFRITGFEDDVPESVRYTVPAINTPRAVMIEMVAPRISKIRITEFVVVHRVMNPLGEDVPLDIAGKHDRQRIDRSEKAEWSGDHKQWQQVPQPSIDVFAIKGIRMMTVVDGIEDFVKVMVDSRLVLKLKMKEPPMGNVFHKGIGR